MTSDEIDRVRRRWDEIVRQRATSDTELRDHQHNLVNSMPSERLDAFLTHIIKFLEDDPDEG